MTDKTISGQCDNCESTYEVEYMEEMVSQEYPEHCPFCGEVIEEITESYIEDDDSVAEEEWD